MSFLGLSIRVKFTPLNRVPFGKFNGASVPSQWANPILFQALKKKPIERLSQLFQKLQALRI